MATMEITIHEEKLAIPYFTGKRGPITSHKNTLYHSLSRMGRWNDGITAISKALQFRLTFD